MSMPVVPELLCVAYVLLMLVCLGSLLRDQSRRSKCLGGDGDFCWGALRWQHLTRDVKSLGSGKLATLRLLFALYIFATTYIMVLAPRHKSGHLALQGYGVLATFTVWSWVLLGFYFLLTGAASAADAMGFLGAADADGTSAGPLARFLWVWFEVMFAISILICLVVWFVLIPATYVTFGNADLFFTVPCLSAHNLNVVFMGVELLVNRLTFVPSHAIFIVLYGLVYVVFSWFWFMTHGVFFYFFLDWRRLLTPVWYTILIAFIYGVFRTSLRLATSLKGESATALLGAGTSNAPRSITTTGNLLRAN